MESCRSGCAGIRVAMLQATRRCCRMSRLDALATCIHKIFEVGGDFLYSEVALPTIDLI
jgi:hypothetical protein